MSLVLVTAPLAAPCATWLASQCEVVYATPNDPEWSVDLARADGIVVRTYLQVTRDLLAAAPRLRVVGRAGVGLDAIDVRACRERGVEVVHTPESNTQAVVEYVLRLVTEAIRPTRVLREAVDTAAWNTMRAETVGRRELRAHRVGILGFGRIGKRLGRVFEAIGATVQYHDLQPIAEADRGGATPVGLDELLATSDLLTIHVDGRPENRHLIDAERLAGTRDDLLLVNTSRGFVVDEVALAARLRACPDMRAILDVHDPEPIRAESGLLACANATLLPHLASRTDAALERMSWVVRDVMAVLQGTTPTFPAPAVDADP